LKALKETTSKLFGKINKGRGKFKGIDKIQKLSK